MTTARSLAFAVTNHTWVPGLARQRWQVTMKKPTHPPPPRAGGQLLATPRRPRAAQVLTTKRGRRAVR